MKRALLIGGVLQIALCISLHAGSQVTAKKAALSTISPFATKVGLDVLKRGGNAADASVAVALSLAVVHPQAGNLGGGGFLIYYDAKTKGVWTLDFREVAPGDAKREMFATLPPTATRVGALSGAVPGSLAGLETLHQRFGSRKWSELVSPAARAAREGFIVDSRLANDLARAQRERNIDQFISTAAIYFADGKPLAAGEKLVQSDLAALLDRIAINGAKELYDGDSSQKFVDGVRGGGGIIGFRDLRDYKPIWRAPIRIDFRDYQLYTIAPPSAGGLVIGETLNILAGYDLAALGYQTPAALHLQVEAMRRAYIDRNKYLGDPASARIPYGELLSAERAKQWRASIDPKRVTITSTLTEPGTGMSEGNHTTHFTIVDEQGNIAALTTTLNEDFGGGFVVPGCGFFLNNEMDDFTTQPGKANRAGLVQGPANAIEPGKRMASSMAPTIVLKGERPFLALGTPGGPTIPTTILQVFLGIAVHRKSLADAVAAPRYHEQALPNDVAVERMRAPQQTLDALSALGHGLDKREAIGDVHALMFEGGRIIAVADPRYGGSAGGY